MITRRALGLVLALALLGAIAPEAGAVTGAEVEAAKARVEQLRREIEAENAELASLETRSGALAARLSEAEGILQQIDRELAQTRADLAEARSTYEDIRARLNERAHMTYINGPGSGLEFCWRPLRSRIWPTASSSSTPSPRRMLIWRTRSRT